MSTLPVSYYYFGIDTLRINLCKCDRLQTLDRLLFGLSVGSPMNYDIKFFGFNMTALYTEHADKYILILQYDNHPVVCIDYLLVPRLKDDARYVVTFYGAYFYLPEIKKILTNFISVYYDYCVISLCDICLDLNTTTDKLLQHDYFSTTARHKAVYSKDDHIETYYIGRVRTQRHWIIVYDKKLDTKKKGKEELFLKYMSEENVTRIELKIHSLSCKVFGITQQDVLDCYNAKSFNDDILLYKIFKQQCCNYNKTCFNISVMNQISSYMTYKQRSEYKKTMSELSLKRWLKQGYKLRLSGYDVIKELTKIINR